MRLFTAVVGSLALALGACSDKPAPPNAGTVSGAVTADDQAAILSVLRLSANADGQVVNECGELSTPQFVPADLGGSVGIATLFAMAGGPNTASCYGDGPDLHLLVRDGATWREIYAARGRMLMILPTTTGGVRDIGDGGPGLSFPIWTWNGKVYQPTGREISDADAAKTDVKYLP